MNLLALTDLPSEILNGSTGENATAIVDIAEGIQKYGIIAICIAVIVVVFLIIIGFVFAMNMRIMKDLAKRSEISSITDDKLIGKLIDNALQRSSTSFVSPDDINKMRKNLSDELATAVAKIEDDIKTHENYVRTVQSDIVSTFSSIDNKQHDVDYVGKFLAAQGIFRDHSRPLINTLKCNRVGVYVFHNGNVSMHGLPFYKMTCIHEYTSTGQKSIRGAHHVNMPLNLYYDFVESLYTNGEYKAENIEIAKNEEESITEFTQYSSCKSIYIVAVKDNRGIIGGFVAVEFDNIETFETDPERGDLIRKSIDEMIKEINPVLISKSVYRKE